MRSAYYLLVAVYLSFWPALVVGVLVHFIEPEWEVIAFSAVFGYVLTEFLFLRKGNWMS